MKKKTAAKKTARRPGRKGSPARERVKTSDEVAWTEKMFTIAMEFPNPPTTGVHKSQGDEYPYTRAQEVFKYYRAAMKKYRVMVVPGAIRTFRDRRAYRVEYEFRFIDVDTGHSESVWCAGTGNNGIWSPTSAMTVAKKEAMLLAFHADWPCEFDVAMEMPEALRTENVFGCSSTSEIRRLMEGYFEAVHAAIQKLQTGGKK